MGLCTAAVIGIAAVATSGAGAATTASMQHDSANTAARQADAAKRDAQEQENEAAAQTLSNSNASLKSSETAAATIGGTFTPSGAGTTAGTSTSAIGK